MRISPRKDTPQVFGYVFWFTVRHIRNRLLAPQPLHPHIERLLKGRGLLTLQCLHAIE